mmetsp:Transcript_24999/g.39278  ORF Transcript_24999/g.39278 Transcript_24999/m.39278 type:complete len:370 (+) Transcript_24999:38-1147(+)
MPNHKGIEMQELSKYFKMPEKAVAKHLGICLTSLKKICRANGIHRWPYRKIKSLDKKLRKLEHAMSTAKDDPSMAHAVSGYSVRSTEGADNESDSGSISPTPSASEASIASTPRLHEWTPSASASPPHGGSPPRMASPVPQRNAEGSHQAAPQAESASRAVPIALNKPSDGKAIKLELSLSPDMLKQMAEGGRNITFVVQNVNGTTQLAPVISDAVSEEGADHALIREDEMEEEPSCKSPEPEHEPEHPDMAGMSDEDIIAMLADCAGKPPAPVKAESFAQVIQDHSATGATHNSDRAVPVLEPSDAELMAALASCCGGASPFEEEETFEGQDGSESSSYGGFDDVMIGFGGAFNVPGMGAEDFLGIHA